MITETNGSASMSWHLLFSRQEPTSLYGPGGKHIFELIDGVSFVIVGDAKAIRCVSL
jgi:hypothetical protein